MSKTPDIIFLYGPAACGKGTQAKLLSEKYPEFVHYDAGTEIRNFIEKNKYSEHSELQHAAMHMEERMAKGFSVDFEDLQLVFTTALHPLIKQKKKIIFDGGFRDKPQAHFLVQFLTEKKLSSALFLIHITLETTIKRLATRWYAANTTTPYASYEEAKKASGDSEPYTRKDDQNIDVIVSRYKSMYELLWGNILSYYQRSTRHPIYVIDGAEPVEEVQRQILQNLEN